MKKKDLLIVLAAGFLTALVWVPVILFLEILPTLSGMIWYLLVIIPVVFAIGLYIALWISRWFAFVRVLAKFVIIGFLNTGIDFVVYNFFINQTGIEKGFEITLFKIASFVIAVVNSFFWNKYWSFEAGDTGRQGTEFAKYFAVTLIGLVLNSGITSSIVNFIPVLGGLTQLVWDNIAAAVATVVSLLWNFIGYRSFVFRKNKI